MSELRRWLPWLAVAALPLALFLVMETGAAVDPVWSIPNGHFLIVTLTSLVTFFFAGLMMVAASQLRDARVVFLSLAFLSIAGIFAVHGLTTPGTLFDGMNPWVGFSARLSLFAGAFFFALSTLGGRPRFNAWVVRQQRAITLGFLLVLLSYAAVALTDASRAPSATTVSEASSAAQAESYGSYGASYGHDHAATPGGASDGRFDFLSSGRVSLAVTLATLGMLAAVIVYYVRLYRVIQTPLIAGLLGSGILLFQSQIIMYQGTTWNASWWLYHVLLLAAFTGTVTGLLVEYSQRGSVGVAVAGLLTRDTLAQLQRGYTDVIVALVGAVEAKDEYTRGHTQRVTQLSVKIGEDLRLPLPQLRTIAQSAMLHDIGKIGVPDSILNKPGPLTDEEFAIIKQHPARGYEILIGVRSLQAELDGVRYHHEKLDGSGYPDGLVGDEIPLVARIITVADMYDALTSARSYRPAWSEQQALDLIDSEAGTKLDPLCVAALHRVVSAEQVSGVAAAVPDHGITIAEAVQREHSHARPVASPHRS